MKLISLFLLIISFSARAQDQAINDFVADAGGDLYEAVYGSCVETIQARCIQENGVVSPELQALLRSTEQITDSTVNGLVDQFYRRAAAEQTGILTCERRRLQAFFGSNGNGRYDPGIEASSDEFARTIMLDACNKMPELKLTYSRFRALDAQMAPVRARQEELARSILPPSGRAANWYVPPSEAHVARVRTELQALDAQLRPITEQRRRLYDRYNVVMASIWKGSNPSMEGYISSQFEQAQPEVCIGANAQNGAAVRSRFRKDESGPVYQMIRQGQFDERAIGNLSNRGKSLLFERSDMGQQLQDYASAGNYRAQLAVCRINAEERGTEAIQQTLDYGSLLLGGVGLALRFARVASIGIRGLNAQMRISRVALLASSAVGTVSAARGISEECFSNIPDAIRSGQTGNCSIGAEGWSQEQRLLESENCALAVAIGAAEVAGGLGDYLDLFKRSGRGFSSADDVSRRVAGQSSRTDAIISGTARVGDDAIEASADAARTDQVITVTATGGTREQRAILTANRLGEGEDVSGRLARLGFTRVLDAPEGTQIFRNANGSQIVLPAGNSYRLSRIQRNQIEVLLNEQRGNFTYPGLARVDATTGRTLADQLGRERAIVISGVDANSVPSIENALGDLQRIANGTDVPVDVRALSPIQRLRLLDQLQDGLRLRNPAFTEPTAMAVYRRTIQGELSTYTQRAVTDADALAGTLRSEFRELSDADRSLVLAGRADEVIARNPAITVDRATRLRSLERSIGDARRTIDDIPGARVPDSIRVPDNLTPARVPAGSAPTRLADIDGLQNLDLENIILRADNGFPDATVREINERLQRYSAAERAEINALLTRISGNPEKQRQYLFLLLNAENPTLLRRLTQLESGAITRADFVRMVDNDVNDLTRRLGNLDINDPGALPLSALRSDLTLQRFIIEGGDDIDVRNIFSARAYNENYRGTGHSLDGSFSADVRVRPGRNIQVCRGTYATAAGGISRVSGDFLTFCRDGNYLSAGNLSDVLAAPYDTGLPTVRQGYRRFSRFELPEGTELTLGRNGPVRYDRGVNEGSGGNGGSIELFCTRKPCTPSMDQLRASVRIPICQRGGATCDRIFTIQEQIRVGNLQSAGGDARRVLEEQRRELDTLINQELALSGRRLEVLTEQGLSGRRTIERLADENPSLYSALQLRREIDVRVNGARDPRRNGGFNVLDVDTQALRSGIDSAEVGPQLSAITARSGGNVTTISTEVQTLVRNHPLTRQMREVERNLDRLNGQLRAARNPADRAGILREMTALRGQEEDLTIGLQVLSGNIRYGVPEGAVRDQVTRVMRDEFAAIFP